MSLLIHFSFQPKKGGRAGREERDLPEGRSGDIMGCVPHTAARANAGLALSCVPRIPKDKTWGHTHSPRKAYGEWTHSRPRGGCGILS